jgi:hypothetical protein
MTTKLQLLHSLTSGNVPPNGLLPGEIAFNVADNLQFVGYGGDVNYDVYGDPLPDLPPPGLGWKTFVTGGGDQPGPPGPGVPEGGLTGQVLSKLTDGDYVTGWVDNFDSATPTDVGVVFGLTTTSLGGNSSTFLGYQAGNSIGSGLRNVVIGFQAGLNQNDVSDNVVIGHQAGWNIDGGENVIIGSEALGNDPGGQASGNIAIGFKSGYNLTEGDSNIFLGREAGSGVRGGDGNVIIGAYPGGSDWNGNVAISDGLGDLKFLANQAGAWSTDGTNFGQAGYILTSQGDGAPPTWSAASDAGVTRIVAGSNVTISPSGGTGVVTISASGGGGGGGGVTAIQANNGLLVSGGGTNPIITSGGLEVDFTKVVATSLYNTNGTLLIGSSSGPAQLPVGTAGQVLQVSQAGAVNWASIPSASPATPTTFGLVYGATGNTGAFYGYGSGTGITGTNNVLLGLNAGTNIGAGANNTVVGAYQGTSGMSNSVALSTGAGSVRFFSNSAGAWSISGDTQFGQAGQVLTSQGSGAAPRWIAPINAPITDVNDGPGISTDIAGTTLTISNEGVLSVAANSPIVAANAGGNITLSAPNVLSDLQQGTGITVSGTGNSRTVTNTGVVQLQNGTNTTVENVGGGVWKVNATGGGGGGITSLTQGTGITITNPSGPSPTIANSGILNVVSATPGTLDVTVTNGVASLSVNGGTGVTKLVAGSNISLSPTSGVGEVTISAAGGGGGGSITQITSAAGSGISVTSGTGPVVTLANTGVLEVAGGTGIRVDPNGPGKFTIVNTQAASSVLSVSGQGAGISVSPTSGAVVVQNTGVTSITGTTGNITASSAAGAVTLDIGTNVLTNVTAGNSGIAVAGTGNTRSISATVAGLTAGAGIDLTNNSGNFTIKNTGVLGLTAGANVTITETTPGSGNFTIASTGGGGGGSGTVTSVTAGSGLIGGTITTSGTLAIDNNIVVRYPDYDGRPPGSMLYTDTTGHDWTGRIPVNNTSGNKAVLQGWTTAAATFVSWGDPNVGGFQNSPSITFRKSLAPTQYANEFVFEISTPYQEQRLLNWNNNAATISAGQIAYGYPSGTTLGDTNYTTNLNPPPLNTDRLYFLSGDFQSFPLTSDKAWKPAWKNAADHFVSSVQVTAPIINSGSARAPVIGFDINTTALTQYIPKSSFALTGQLLYGTGAGTFSALNIGNNGQVLTVSASGTPVWANPSSPGSPISLTPADDTILMTPSPITGTGTIGVNSTKFVQTSVIQSKGDMIYGGAAGVPARLSAGTSGQVLQMSNTGVPAWVTDLDAGTY